MKKQQFLRIMEGADRVDTDRTQSTTTAYRHIALSKTPEKKQVTSLSPEDATYLDSAVSSALELICQIHMRGTPS